MNSEAAGTEWIDCEVRMPLLGQLVLVVIGGVVQNSPAELGEEYWYWKNDEYDSAPIAEVSHWMPMPKFPEARLVPQPATEPTILANLTKHEFERLSHGRIPYSGAAGDPHYDKDPRPWGKHAPYIATYLGELIPAVKAMKWTHFSVKHEHGQWLALRDTQPATEPRITAQEYWPIWVEEKHSEIAGFVAYDRAKAIEFAEDYVAALALRDVPQGQTDEQLVIDLARELYDRFLMGGWTPEDAYPQIRAMLAARQVPVSSEKEK